MYRLQKSEGHSITGTVHESPWYLVCPDLLRADGETSYGIWEGLRRSDEVLTTFLFIYLFIHSSIYLFIYLFIYVYIYLFVYLSVYLFIYLFIYLYLRCKVYSYLANEIEITF
jgi:hypothetical protein